MQAKIVIFFLFVFVSACGASALDRTATVLGSAYVAQKNAVHVTEQEIENDLREHCKDAEDKPGCVEERAQRWRRVVEGFDVSAAALDNAAVEVMRWAASESDEDVIPPSTCERVSAAVASVSAILNLVRSLGVSIPEANLVFSCGEE